MSAPADQRLVIVSIGGVLGLALGLGFGHWQHQRTLGVVEARHQAERAAVAEAVAQLNQRLDSLRDEVASDRQDGRSERQRIAASIHVLSTSVEELRLLSLPVVAELTPDDFVEPTGVQ